MNYHVKHAARIKARALVTGVTFCSRSRMLAEYVNAILHPHVPDMLLRRATSMQTAETALLACLDADLFAPPLLVIDTSNTGINDGEAAHLVARCLQRAEQNAAAPKVIRLYQGEGRPQPLCPSEVALSLDNTDAQMLVETVQSVLSGKAALTRNVTPTGAAPMSQRRVPPPMPSFTHREMEVLARILRGERNIEIANHLGIALGTVKSHITKMFRKTGAHSRLSIMAEIERHPALVQAIRQLG